MKLQSNLFCSSQSHPFENVWHTDQCTGGQAPKNTQQKRNLLGEYRFSFHKKHLFNLDHNWENCAAMKRVTSQLVFCFKGKILFARSPANPRWDARKVAANRDTPTLAGLLWFVPFWTVCKACLRNCANQLWSFGGPGPTLKPDRLDLMALSNWNETLKFGKDTPVDSSKTLAAACNSP